MSGKFGSELAERLYDYTLDSSEDSSFGESETFGWYALFADEKAIISVNSQGFVDAATYASEEETRAAWDKLEADYSAWLDRAMIDSLDTSVCDGLFLMIDTAKHVGSLPDMDELREHVHTCPTCRERNLWALDA